MDSDEELMCAAAAGDLDAYERLVDRHRRTAFGLAYRLLNRPGAAEEVAQEAFLKIFKARESYEPTASFKTYLCRVVSRLCYDRTEKNEPVNLDPKQGADSRAGLRNPERKLIDEKEKKAVRKALAELPRRQREAIVLQHFEGMKYSQISEVMGTTEKAVERLLARARERLSELLKRAEETPVVDPSGGRGESL